MLIAIFSDNFFYFETKSLLYNYINYNFNEFLSSNELILNIIKKSSKIKKFNIFKYLILYLYKESKYHYILNYIKDNEELLSDTILFLLEKGYPVNINRITDLIYSNHILDITKFKIHLNNKGIDTIKYNFTDYKGQSNYMILCKSTHKNISKVQTLLVELFSKGKLTFQNLKDIPEILISNDLLDFLKDDKYFINYFKNLDFRKRTFNLCKAVIENNPSNLFYVPSNLRYSNTDDCPISNEQYYELLKLSYFGFGVNVNYFIILMKNKYKVNEKYLNKLKLEFENSEIDKEFKTSKRNKKIEHNVFEDEYLLTGEEFEKIGVYNLK